VDAIFTKYCITKTAGRALIKTPAKPC